MNNDFEKLYKKLLNVKYSFSDEYKLTYLTPDRYVRVSGYISEIRRCNYMDTADLHVLIDVFKIYMGNYYKVRRLQENEPRKIAQKFIGKKNVRTFIFKRDNYKCLLCSSSNRLQIDHIIPITKGGKNKISNLQTLCGSCNSRKSNNFADYRNNKTKK